MDYWSDLSLVQRAKQSDADAFQALIERHYPMVYALAYKYAGLPADAEDIAQEVFIRAARGLGGFREAALFTTWLYRITANVVRDRHRRWRVRQSLDVFKTWLFGKDVPTPEAVAVRASAGRAIEEVLARMSPKKREVFALYELEGLEGEQIADRLGCPIGTVWTRLHHARKDFVKIARRLGCLEELP